MHRANRFRVVGALLFLLLLWMLLATAVGNDWLLPYPADVGQRMLQQLSTATFYISILYTLLRALLGLCGAFCLAFFCAYGSYRSAIFRDILYPFLLLARSIPNISYILIVLVWCSAESSAAIICFLILFPTIYSSLYNGWLQIDVNLQRVIALYPAPFWERMLHVYLPLLKGAVYASISNGISLAFKVGVMAEIIGQVQVGIGRQLNICRLSFDMNGLFAWTVWIILLLVAVEGIIHLLVKKQMKGDM